MRSNALGSFWEVYFGVAVVSGPPRQVLGKPVFPFRGRTLLRFPLECRSLMQSLELPVTQDGTPLPCSSRFLVHPRTAAGVGLNPQSVSGPEVSQPRGQDDHQPELPLVTA
jgi:hypothetical protein